MFWLDVINFNVVNCGDSYDKFIFQEDNSFVDILVVYR